MEKISILLAEDHIVVREGIKDLIQRENDMEVVGEASTGGEAVRMAQNLNPDIVLMDIAMPEMNGIEATKKIKSSHPHISILILTAYDNEEFIFAVIEAKAAGYMLKNVRGQELLNAIRAVYAGDSVLHPSITKKVLQTIGTSTPHTTVNKRVLTARELQVVKLGAQGLPNKEIADKLNLSVRTIQTHWRNIFVKIGVSSRLEVIMHCLKLEWITLDEYDKKGTY
ncbi:MAG: response regulator transcription factor [Spirochaetales bacterium]|nr:response regulator transcription factor [Spirochaetales bacterium]